MVKVLKTLAFGSLAVVMAWTAAPQPSLAQDMKAVEARQKAMRGFGGNSKAAAMFLKKGEGSLADIESRLRRMAAAAPKIAGWFPKGTGSEELGIKVSGAKPEIWSDAAGFKKAADTFGMESAKLAQVAAKGDKAAFAAAFKTFGKNACGTCHRTFRAKRPKN